MINENVYCVLYMCDEPEYCNIFSASSTFEKAVECIVDYIIAQDEEIDEVEIENDLKKSHKVEFGRATFSIWSKKIDA